VPERCLRYDRIERCQQSVLISQNLAIQEDGANREFLAAGHVHACKGEQIAHGGPSFSRNMGSAHALEAPPAGTADVLVRSPAGKRGVCPIR
jgi:hypothetical protein